MTTKTLPPSGWVYLAVVALLGAVVLTLAVRSVQQEPIGWNWFVLAALTLATGSATVKLPSAPATISISETFVFTSTLLYGPAAGTLTVALDALVISYSLARRGHPWYRILFNVSALPASLWIGAQVFFWTAQLPPLATLPQAVDIPLAQLIKPLILFTIFYFGLNSWLIALAISLERAMPPFQVWRRSFAWLSLNYFGGASVAALLVTYTREIDYALLALIIPLLAVLYFTFSTAQGRIEDTNAHLTKLNSLYMSTIETLAMAIDAKDQVTHGHIRRVQQYAVALAQKVGVSDSAHISAIEAASLLHDMGKLAVPEYILNKPGPLTPVEFEKMKLHASVGADILSSIDFPYPVVPIVRHHHENWDGSGYPDGLRGLEIPIGARILSVVDCFDALTSDRPYRPKLSDDAALRVLQERRGTMYDPVIVDTFIEIHTTVATSPEVRHASAQDGLSAITRSHGRSEEQTLRSHGFSEINANREEGFILFEMTRALAMCEDRHQATAIVFRHLKRLFPPSTFVFYAFDESKDLLSPTYVEGENADLFSNVRFERGQRLTGWIAANRQGVLNSDPVLDLGDAARTARPPLKSYVGAAAVDRSTLLGVLAVYSSQFNAFTEDHLRILQRAASESAETLNEPGLAVEGGKASSFDLPIPDSSQLDRFVTAQLAQRQGHLAILGIDLRQPAATGAATSLALKSLVFAVREAIGPDDFLFSGRETTLVCVLLDSDDVRAKETATRVLATLQEIALALGQSAVRARVSLAIAPENGRSARALLDYVRQGTATESNRSVH